MVLPEAAKDCIAGGLAGFCTDAIQHPMLTIKNRLQTQGSSGAYSYKGPLDAARQIVHSEGVRGLYKGYTAIAFATPAFSLYFMGYQFIQGIGRDYPSLAPAVHAGGGIFAQMCGALVWVPTDVMKEKMQIQTKAQPGYENFVRAARTVIAKDGVLGLYRGYWPHQLAWGPFNMFYWSFFEQLKATGRPHTGGEDTIPLVLTTSLMAGTAAAAITAPIDNLKVRIQTQGTPMRDGTPTRVYGSIPELVMAVWRSEGPAGFMRGASARVMAAAPATMIVQTLYAGIKSQF